MDTKTAKEAGWKYSEYNLFAREPERNKIAWLNTLSGSCSEFSMEEYQLIQRVLDLPEDHRYIQHYAGRGLITRQDERKEIRRRLSEFCADHETLHLTICPTLACNFDCPYCFEKHIPGRMSPDVMEEIVRFAECLLKRHSFQNVSVRWFGGEPLLGIDVIEKLSERLIALAEAHNAVYRAEIITNGYLLNEHAVEVLQKGKTVKAQITLDGLKESHDRTRCLTNGLGTFDTIVSNIRARHIPFLIDIRHNVTRENRSGIEPLRSFVEELAEESGNTITYYASPVFESAAADERDEKVSVLERGEDSEFVYRDAYETFLQNPMGLCEAARRYAFTIDHEGNLYTCDEKAGDPAERYGTILEYDPDDSEPVSSNPGLIQYYRSLDHLFESCGDCVFLPKCRGECPVKRRTGTAVCPEYKENPEAYVRYICEQLKARKEAETDKPVQSKSEA